MTRVRSALGRDPIREACRQWVDHGGEESAAGMAMVTSLARVHQILMDRIEDALRPHDLTFARFRPEADEPTTL